ncbi:hypothetical protein Lal_00013312, partial [Lupinus albus]
RWRSIIKYKPIRRISHTFLGLLAKIKGETTTVACYWVSHVSPKRCTENSGLSLLYGENDDQGEQY